MRSVTVHVSTFPAARAGLEPGDLLYLPPDIPHDGIAVGESITASVGFRVPDPRELAASFIRQLPPEALERFADPGRKRASALGEIASSDRASLRANLIGRIDDDFDHWLGRYVTQPLRDAPSSGALDSIDALWQQLELGQVLERTSPAHFAWFTDARGVVQLFIGGEAFRLGRKREALAELLCGNAPLDAATLAPHRDRPRFVEAIVDAILRGYLRWQR